MKPIHHAALAGDVAGVTRRVQQQGPGVVNASVRVRVRLRVNV